jgi:acyl carrier protein
VHDAVVVLARTDRPGDTRLVAYVVASPDAWPAPGELRSFLQKTIPDYMLPSTFVRLDSLPLTRNGKVDRRALPAPDRGRRDVADAFVAPRIPVEDVVAGIWAEVLQVERVGIHDNFFELGGHSLLATQVVSRLRATFHVELPLRRLFEGPTVAGLAAALLEDPEAAPALDATARLLLAMSELSDADVKALVEADKGRQDQAPA